jgi:hypothetical protein
MNDSLKKAWKALMVAQHHDIQIVGLENAAKTFLKQSCKLSEKIINEQLKNISKQKNDNNKSEKILFNPLSWDRKSRITTNEGLAEFKVPALGFAEIISDAKNHQSLCNWFAKERTLKTPFYKVTFNSDGSICNLKNHEGYNLLKPDMQNGCLSGLIEGKETISQADSFEVKVQAGSADIFQNGLIGTIRYGSQWTFYDNSQEIDYKASLTINNEKIGRLTSDKADSLSAFVHEDKLCLRLFPNVSDKIICLEDQPFANGETANKCLQGNYWNAVTDGKIGLAIFNKGLMCSVLNEQNCVFIPLAYSMYYVWNTIILNGTYEYELQLLPFTGDWKKQNLHKKALEFNFPCVKFEADEIISVSQKNCNPIQNLCGDAILSALFTDGKNTYLRFYEYLGKKTEVSFEWMGKQACFEEVDFRLRPICKLGSVLPLSPWQVRTVKIIGCTPEKDYPVEHKTKYERRKHGGWQKSSWFKAEKNGNTKNFDW